MANAAYKMVFAVPVLTGPAPYAASATPQLAQDRNVRNRGVSFRPGDRVQGLRLELREREVIADAAVEIAAPGDRLAHAGGDPFGDVVIAIALAADEQESSWCPASS